MLIETMCPYCHGSGIRMIESSSLLGLIKKNVPSTCEFCSGLGSMVDMPKCGFCSGQGLLGNEREICRTCNGTGKADSFSFIPRELLKPFTTFTRHCDKCASQEFEVTGEVEQYKLTRSWEQEEELRHVEIVERVKVHCTGCGNSYAIPIDNELHQQLEPQTINKLEELGVDLKFLYQQQ